MRRFKVARGLWPSHLCPASIPWEMIEPHREQVTMTYGRSLEELNEGGGLNPKELYAVLQDRDPEKIETWTAVEFLKTRLKEFGGAEHHWRDGWFFSRTHDGSVKIEKREPANPEGRVVIALEIPPVEWASIVVSVSENNHTAETWQQALKFHGANDE